MTGSVYSLSRQERFSADVSHQLKTPLAVLKTQAAVALASQHPHITGTKVCRR
ncbi:hypothetical protein KCP73_18850 [Salmonella enterica subsp. enterica]|nr:hypothetical protein KCP73_18850 [Salmonella enterica subsp. enterica]